MLHCDAARRAFAEVIARKTGVTLYLREQPKTTALKAAKVQLADGGRERGEASGEA
jgi:hypothetical protein